MAPDGQEAIFLTLSGLPAKLIYPTVGLFNGWLNEAYVPNCRLCRDDVGSFCSTLLHVGLGGCASSSRHECSDLELVPTPGLRPLASDLEVASTGSNRSSIAVSSCPLTCLQCPGYEGHAQQMFSLVLLIALTSPLLISLMVPWLRGQYNCPCLGRDTRDDGGDAVASKHADAVASKHAHPHTALQLFRGGTHRQLFTDADEIADGEPPAFRSGGPAHSTTLHQPACRDTTWLWSPRSLWCFTAFLVMSPSF